jgi:rubrerythrin
VGILTPKRTKEAEAEYDFEVEADRSRGLYSIELKLQYDDEGHTTRTIPLHTSMLVEALDKASHYQEQGLSDKLEPSYRIQQVGQVGQPVGKEVYREKEILREVIKIRCRNCGTLFEEKLDTCSHCGAPP